MAQSSNQNIKAKRAEFLIKSSAILSLVAMLLGFVHLFLANWNACGIAWLGAVGFYFVTKYCKKHLIEEESADL